MRSIKTALLVLIISMVPMIIHADCIDFASALPGQTYLIASEGNIQEMELIFGQSTAVGFCPAGEALLRWVECITENGKEYCATQELPLSYQTTDGSNWILLPNFALAWLMGDDLYLIPRNTPMLQLKSKSSSGAIPWGGW